MTLAATPGELVELRKTHRSAALWSDVEDFLATQPYGLKKQKRLMCVGTRTGDFFPNDVAYVIACLDQPTSWKDIDDYNEGNSVILLLTSRIVLGWTYVAYVKRLGTL